ncbi:MAG TPA: ATP-dependent sacrificial sulfur transferase LarE [Acidimicrobiales bacterium]|nr:ATP-dependent sacrificial sulfur transferase LarE [Acidimicrobiales bacterium]
MASDDRAKPAWDALARLEAVLARLDRVVVAFSGGADSSLVAAVATKLLSTKQVLCATAVSASLAPDDQAHCSALVAEWGLRWVAVSTHELDNPAYVRNDLDRCYHCKLGLMDVLAPLAESEDATVVLGVNLDDLTDHRPGQRAAAERGAVFPLVEAGLDKTMVRRASLALGLRTWDRPAAACLASRVPHGTPVSFGILEQVAKAESSLRQLGFGALRVRHYGELARIELPLEDLERAIGTRDEIVEVVRDAGYRYVTLDLEGLRSGNLSRSAAAGAVAVAAASAVTSHAATAAPPGEGRP